MDENLNIFPWTKRELCEFSWKIKRNCVDFWMKMSVNGVDLNENGRKSHGFRENGGKTLFIFFMVNEWKCEEFHEKWMDFYEKRCRKEITEVKSR